MPAGRPRKPTPFKILNGTFKKSRDPSGVAGVGRPKPPGWLGGEALAFWKKTVPGLERLGILAAVDSTALALMCWQWATWRRFSAELDKADAELDKADLKLVRRLMILASMASTSFDKLAFRFGMTPADRAKLHIEPPRAEKMMARKR